MQYHDIQYGYYSRHLNQMKHGIDVRFASLEDIIQSEIRFTRNDWTRYSCITESNKLVACIYWDHSNGLTVRRFN